MKSIIVGCDQLLGPWVASRLEDSYLPGAASYIGLARDGKVIAAVRYSDYNGPNINMHVASEGKNWLNKEFLWFTFYYPFVQLRCKRITAIVPGHNTAAIKFDEHLGFTFEAALKDAHPKGDLLIYRMFEKDCRWHRLKGIPNAPHAENSSIHLPGRTAAQGN